MGQFGPTPAVLRWAGEKEDAELRAALVLRGAEHEQLPLPRQEPVLTRTPWHSLQAPPLTFLHLAYGTTARQGRHMAGSWRERWSCCNEVGALAASVGGSLSLSNDLEFDHAAFIRL